MINMETNSYQEEPQHDLFKLIEAIKKHSKAKGHDRCWLNDQELYITAGIIPEDPQLPSKEEFLRGCEEYYELQCHKNTGNKELP